MQHLNRLTERGGQALWIFGVPKCLKMDIYGINCMYEMGSDDRSIYKATMLIDATIFIDLVGESTLGGGFSWGV